MAEFSLSKTAKAKLTRIYEYSFLNFGEDQADAYIDSLFETFDQLATLPRMGREWRRWRRHSRRARYLLFDRRRKYRDR